MKVTAKDFDKLKAQYLEDIRMTLKISLHS